MTVQASLKRVEHNESTTIPEFVGWRPDELTLLRQLWTAGTALAEIAGRLGRSTEAVRSRARRLRLTPRRNRRGSVGVAAVGVERSCLTCTAEFVSEGPHNRLCDTCRSGADADYRVAL